MKNRPVLICCCRPSHLERESTIGQSKHGDPEIQDNMELSEIPKTNNYDMNSNLLHSG